MTFPSQSRKKDMILRGVIFTVALGLAVGGCIRHNPIVMFGSVFGLGITSSVEYARYQGQKLADAHMRRAGLEPDRDEGPASL